MAWTDVPGVDAGVDELTAAMWNTYVRGNLHHLHKLLTSPPMIIARRSPQTTLGPGNPNIALTSIVRDTMPAWGYSPGWNAGQNIYIWLRHPGLYQVFANVMFDHTTFDFALRLWRDGSDLIAIDQPRTHAAASGANPIATVVSDGTTRIHMQVQGTTDGLVMLAGATLGAFWLRE